MSFVYDLSALSFPSISSLSTVSTVSGDTSPPQDEGSVLSQAEASVLDDGVEVPGSMDVGMSSETGVGGVEGAPFLDKYRDSMDVWTGA